MNPMAKKITFLLLSNQDMNTNRHSTTQVHYCVTATITITTVVIHHCFEAAFLPFQAKQINIEKQENYKQNLCYIVLITHRIR